MTPRFEIVETRTTILRRHRWHVRLIGVNGEPLSHSEQLSSKAAAHRNVEAQRGAAHRAGSPIVTVR